MTNLKQFNVALDGQLDELDEKNDRGFAGIVKEFYNGLIFDGLPFFTGYYRSNHRISISGVPLFELVPQVKSASEAATRGVFGHRMEITRAEELSKLTKLTGVERITVGSAVPYADDVEAKHGVYKRAAKAVR